MLQGFREKNSEVMRQDIIDVLTTSKADLVRAMIGLPSYAIHRWRTAHLKCRAVLALMEPLRTRSRRARGTAISPQKPCKPGSTPSRAGSTPLGMSSTHFGTTDWWVCTNRLSHFLYFHCAAQWYCVHGGEGRRGGGYCVHRRDRRGEERGRVLCA